MLSWFASSAVVALIVAVVVRQRGWSMALPVMGVGVIVGMLPIGPDAPPQPELVLIVILAPLVFGEAMGSSYLDIRRVYRPVLYLAIGLVIATTIVVGFVTSWYTGMPLALGFALGAILAPTDAVAVSAIARKVGLPRWVVSILEGESLVNDGTGLTALRVALVAATAGVITAAEIGWVFVLAVCVGIGVGLLAGYLLSWVISHSSDAIAANSLTLIAPFFIYFVAEHFEGSGILAVVIAALFIAHAQISDSRQESRLEGVALWSHVTFILKALAFFLVGLVLPTTFYALGRADQILVLKLVAMVTVALIVTRLVFVSLMVWSRRRHDTVEWRVSLAGAWSGARGPVSGMAAFSVPLTLDSGAPLPFRNVILATTFGVIVVTLLLSLTMGPVARLLNVQATDDDELIRCVHVSMAHAAGRQLDEAMEQASLRGEPLPREVLEPIQRALDLRIAALDDGRTTVVREQLTQRSDLARLMLRAEQEELIRYRSEEGLPDSIVRPLLEQLDIRRLALATHPDPRVPDEG